jgi:UDP:flavonoid glycosyltransferase YjiC (YdhE family)
MVVDQFDTAHHIRTLGLGVSVPMKDYREDTVTDKLIQILSGNGIRHTSQRFAARFAEKPALDDTCETIEQLNSGVGA